MIVKNNERMLPLLITKRPSFLASIESKPVLICGVTS